MARQNILTFVFVLALLGGIYFWYSSYYSGEEDFEAELTSQSEVSSDFFNLLALLERIEINTEFFDDPSFQELEGGVELPPPPKVDGKSNPFGPF